MSSVENDDASIFRVYKFRSIGSGLIEIPQTQKQLRYKRFPCDQPGGEASSVYRLRRGGKAACITEFIAYIYLTRPSKSQFPLLGA